jgi:hypothetical protein
MYNKFEWKKPLQEKEEAVTRHRLFFLTVAIIFGILLTISCATVQELFAVPTATSTPTITLALPPDLSKAVLTQDDFPIGLIEIPLDELGLSGDDLSGDGFKFESFFAFLEASKFQFIMGFTTLLSAELEQGGFDLFLTHPEVMIGLVATNMGATGISEEEELAGLDDIGDASAGLTMVVDLEGIPMRMDMAVFRRNIVGAIAVVIYAEGGVPVVPVGDVARKLDARIVEILQPTN